MPFPTRLHGKKKEKYKKQTGRKPPDLQSGDVHSSPTMSGT